MTALTDDEITAAAIEQALREVPEPTREQAHDAVCAQIRALSLIYASRFDANGFIDSDDADDMLTDIRRLEHAAQLLRGANPKPGPIPMVLHCPSCGLQHVDAPEPEANWHNPPHKSHLCHRCGLVWRPADVPTTGVVSVSRGSADTWP